MKILAGLLILSVTSSAFAQARKAAPAKARPAAAPAKPTTATRPAAPRAARPAASPANEQLKLYLQLKKEGLLISSTFPLLRILQKGSVDQKVKVIQLMKALPGMAYDADVLAFIQKNSDVSMTPEYVWLQAADTAAEKGDLRKAKEVLSNVHDAKLAKAKSLRRAVIALEEEDTKTAETLLLEIWNTAQNKKVNSVSRGDLALFLGQTYYQARAYDKSLDFLREIPKDHPRWREAVFSQAWTYFRLGRFRSSLSQLQTLHAPFYETHFDPESLFLRGVIYLFACQFDEIEKVATSFQNNYLTVLPELRRWVESNVDLKVRGDVVVAASKALVKMKQGNPKDWKEPVPFFVVRTALFRTDIRHNLARYERIQKEAAKIGKLNMSATTKKALLSYLKKRSTRLLIRMGASLRDEVIFAVNDIQKQDYRFDFLKLEMLGGKRRQLKAQMSGQTAVDEALERDDYVKNGYRYWPFQGEYWKDEIGNYFYLGENRCAALE